MRGRIMTTDEIMLEQKTMMKARETHPKTYELRVHWQLLDKIKNGYYLREDEVRVLKKLERKYCNTRITTNDLNTATTIARDGGILYI